MKQNTRRILAGGLVFASSSFLPGCGETFKDYPEVQQFGADTFKDYATASGVGPHIMKGAEVRVYCVERGPVEAAPSVNGVWYLLSEPDEVNGLYVAANTFENGSTEGPLSEQPAVDPIVPECPEE